MQTNEYNNCSSCNVHKDDIFGFQFTRSASATQNPWDCLKCIGDKSRARIKEHDNDLLEIMATKLDGLWCDMCGKQLKRKEGVIVIERDTKKQSLFCEQLCQP